jgi:hypothetical protein
MVYAIAYTFFLVRHHANLSSNTLLIPEQGYGLSFGSQLFSFIYSKANSIALAEASGPVVLDYFQGFFTAYNGSNAGVPMPAMFAYPVSNGTALAHIVQGVLFLF